MLRNRLVMTDGQDARSGYQFTLADDERTVMERGVLKEDILNQTRRDGRIQSFAGLDDILEVIDSGDNDESTRFGGRHMAASLGDLEHLLTGSGLVFVSALKQGQ